mgnify:CR=1 FL=1
MSSSMSVVETVYSIVSFSVIFLSSMYSLNLLYFVSFPAAALIPIFISFLVLRAIFAFFASVVSIIPGVAVSS